MLWQYHASCGSKGALESCSSYWVALHRSKDDILEEIRRLQSEMAKFEDGVAAADEASKEN